jgi:UDPglucose 6-dehydrogenase
METTLGIVGQGFVGGAAREHLSRFFRVETHDPKFLASQLNGGPSDVRCTKASIKDLCAEVRIVFVCVPTPMRKDGSADLSIVNDVVRQVAQAADDHVAVVKSTVPPGTTEGWNMLYGKPGKFQVVFQPEFLTEANAAKDFEEQSRVIIGGPRPASTRVKLVFERAFLKIPIVKTSSTIAEMVKYATNCFLMTKVLFANEMHQICEALSERLEQDVDWDKVVEYAKSDARMGESHWGVPGPDGHLGAGGSCFPKDVNALISACEEMGVDAKILKAVWSKNLDVRPERDWEQLKGRAVSG